MIIEITERVGLWVVFLSLCRINGSLGENFGRIVSAVRVALISRVLYLQSGVVKTVFVVHPM